MSYLMMIYPERRNQESRRNQQMLEVNLKREIQHMCDQPCIYYRVRLTLHVGENLKAVMMIMAKVHSHDDVSKVSNNGNELFVELRVIPHDSSGRVHPRGYVSCHKHLES